jgi:hypothetical protein
MKQPKIEPTPELGLYRNTEDYVLFIFGITIRIPAGFVFDGASIPFFAWILTYTPHHPVVMLAAMVHDYLYLTHFVSREQADMIFKSLLLKNYCSPEKAALMHRCVRLGGGMFWGWSEKDKDKIRFLQNLVGKENLVRYHLDVEIL